MSHKYGYEYTDTFCGEANYSWVKSGMVYVPELTHYGYSGGADGSYSRASKAQMRQAMRAVKAELGLTSVRGRTSVIGDTVEFRPYRSNTVLFVTFGE